MCTLHPTSGAPYRSKRCLQIHLPSRIFSFTRRESGTSSTTLRGRLELLSNHQECDQRTSALVCILQQDEWLEEDFCLTGMIRGLSCGRRLVGSAQQSHSGRVSYPNEEGLAAVQRRGMADPKLHKWLETVWHSKMPDTSRSSSQVASRTAAAKIVDAC